MYTSLKTLYRDLMFPKNAYKQGWTMAQIDETDVQFFNDLLSDHAEKPQEEEVYLSAIW